MIAELEHVASKGIQLAELRLDYIARPVDLSRLLKNKPCSVVLTVRRREDGGRWVKSEEERQMLLRSAIAGGQADFVDLEADIASEIPRYGHTKRVISFHDFESTPENLEQLHEAMAAEDADIVKIATMANRFDDCMRMIRLVRNAKIPTIGICMGEMGMLTRILANRLGSPFTYASYSKDKKVAPGLIPWEKLRDMYRFDSIDEETELFGVIADPVAHSHSPLIHNAAFEKDALNACYLPFRVTADDLGGFLEHCPELGVRGLSVTIPHKEDSLELCSQAEAAATGIGAVNTIILDDDEQLGYNTDYRAAMDCIEEVFKNRKADTNEGQKKDASEELISGVVGAKEGKSLSGFRALLLGAGGVSRAIAWGLVQRGMEVVVTSRTQSRSDRLVDELRCASVPWDKRTEVRFDLLINGTPLGMFPKVDETPFPDYVFLDEHVVFDTVYNPEQTMLIKEARRARATVITGVDMFVRQAVYQYKLFTGRSGSASLMRAKLKEATSPRATESVTPSSTPSEDPLIRDATAADVAGIQAMLHPYVVERKLLRRTDDELRDLVKHAFVAVDSSTQSIVGFCAVEVYSSKLAEIQSLAVHPQFRKLGLGKKLVHCCVERAKSLGVMEVLAISSSEDFLRSCGFDYSLPDQKKALFFQLRQRPTGEDDPGGQAPVDEG